MKKPFVVGDRVRVYGHIQKMYGSMINANGGEFVVDNVGDDELFVSRHEAVYYAHPKQCRRLVSKAKRRVWITRISLDAFPNASVSACTNFPANALNPENWVEFVEVKRV